MEVGLGTVTSKMAYYLEVGYALLFLSFSLSSSPHLFACSLFF
jgi:hypothetical protein